MAEKKSVRRFTIQFNKNDPAHLNAADILNRLEWRGKAQYVADAVLHYFSRGETVSAEPGSLDNRQCGSIAPGRMVGFDERQIEKHIEAVVERLLRERQQNSGVAELSPPRYSPAGQLDEPQPDQPQEVEDINLDDALDALGEDGFNVITGALDMFRKK